MAKRTDKEPPRPTDAELQILRVLWDRGPSTVRQVRETLSDRKAIGYTTALKLMQIMTEKGLVVRDESQRSHIYRASVPAQKTQRRLVADLLDRAFSGAADQLVVQALSTKPVSRDELSEIRSLLDAIEQELGDTK